MAKTIEITRVVGNRGRAFGSYKKTYKRKGSHHAFRSNTGGEILAYNLATGNPGARKGTMAQKKRKSYSKKPGSKSRYKKNTGKSHHHSGGHSHTRKYPKRRNTGSSAGMGSVGGLVTTGTFAIVGALGSKLGAQLVLGTNNTGPVGYLGNARDWSSQLSKLRTEYNALRADLRAIRFCEPESSEAQYVARRVVELCKWNRWEIPLEALST